MTPAIEERIMWPMPVMPRHGEWTVRDLEDIPDDGLQYELADGVLLVSPSPFVPHQRAQSRLFRVLLSACPADLEVFASPLDFQPTDRRSLQPDLLVVPRSQVTGDKLEGVLSLAVEVLSTSTRSKDLVLKHSLYADSGVPSYWVVDPRDRSLRVWELRGSAYVEVAHALGDEEVALTKPFPVTVRPGDLFD